jgi:Immunity protein Imm1
MKKITLSGDQWSGIYNQEWQHESPSSDDFSNALRNLDALKHTMLTIHADDEAHLTIAGGNSRYVVYATFDNEEFWNLLGSGKSTEIVMLNAGGQEGDFPARQVVDLNQAMSAGLAFLGSQQLDSFQKWERQ